MAATVIENPPVASKSLFVPTLEELVKGKSFICKQGYKEFPKETVSGIKYIASTLCHMTNTSHAVLKNSETKVHCVVLSHKHSFVINQEIMEMLFTKVYEHKVASLHLFHISQTLHSISNLK